MKSEACVLVRKWICSSVVSPREHSSGAKRDARNRDRVDTHPVVRRVSIIHCDVVEEALHYKLGEGAVNVVQAD